MSQESAQFLLFFMGVVMLGFGGFLRDEGKAALGKRVQLFAVCCMVPCFFNLVFKAILG